LTSKPAFNEMPSRGADGSVYITDGGAIPVDDWNQGMNLAWISVVFQRGWGRHDPFAGIIQIKFI
jgi:hypothetical protein